MADSYVAYGDFDLPAMISELSDSDNDYLATIHLDDLVASTVISNSTMAKELETPEYPELNGPVNKRFKSCTMATLDKLEEERHSSSTKKNTAWGTKVFQEWHNEVHGIPMDVATVETTVLAEALRRFYCEAAPKVTDSRMKTLTENHAGEYHTNTLKNIRSAINRHLKDLHRPVDIVKDVEFTRANSTLDGFLKSRVSSGASRETKHKEVLQDEDLSQIAKYLSDGYPDSPIILRECIWYIIAIHFVSRGLEFHHQLHRDSFEFCKDANGEYVTLNHQVKENTDQGGIENKKGHPKSEKHVYATGDALCPVKLLQLFISKTDPSASMLFNQYNKEALEKPLETGIWYTSKPLAKRSFSNFMKDICIGAKLAKTYTPHCLRATAIQAMNDAGFEARHIMFMSGHKSEASLRSYNRSCSSKQKKALSATLGALTVNVPNSTSQEVPISKETDHAATISEVAPNTMFDIQPQFTQNNRHEISKFDFF